MLPAIATLVGFAADDVQKIKLVLREDELGMLGKLVHTVVGSPEKKRRDVGGA